MKLLLSALFISLLGFTSCNSDSDDVPPCIDALSTELQSEMCRDLDADLTLWELNGREVYCFFYGTCTTDSKAVIYDENCNEVCSLFGLSGNTVCEGVVWDDSATRIELIYTF